MDWAENERSEASIGNRYLYTGREWLGEVGFYDYRHRMYDPGLGRFLQTDPTGFDAGDMNLFRYCGDDPVDRSDPTGLYDRNSALLSSGGGDWVWFNGGEVLNQLQAQQEQRTGGLIMADQYRTEGQAAAKSSDEPTINKGRRILARQTKEGEDTTGAFVNGEPVPGDRNWKGQQVPYRFGKPVYKNPNAPRSLRRVDHIEEPVPPGHSDLLTHYHTRGGQFAQPTPYDMDALTTTKAMLFSNPYLKAAGAYRIYRNGVPYEMHYDLYAP